MDVSVPETGALIRLARPRRVTAEEFSVLMEEAGLNQTALATLLGKVDSLVHRWRRGTTPVPGYAIAYLDLVRVARRAGIGFEESRQGLRRKIAA